jgi:hypothetical protein
MSQITNAPRSARTRKCVELTLLTSLSRSVGYHELGGKDVGVEEAKAAPKVSWKRITKFFVWFFAAIAGLIVVLAMVLAVADVIHWHNVRRDFFGGPEMKVFPKPLPNTSLAVAQGVTTLTLSGCSIDIPWANLTVFRGYWVRLPDRRSVFFQDPAMAVDEAGNFRQDFNDPAFKSNYDYLSAQLNFDPAELTPLPWGHGHQLKVIFAAGKSLLPLTHKDQPIYSVALGDVRGFQLGDPKLGNGLVELKMFDPKDRQFRLRIDSGNPDAPWTQPEINFIIHSMHCDEATYSAARHAWGSRFHEVDRQQPGH